LKHVILLSNKSLSGIFILLSIKTRIETSKDIELLARSKEFLSYYPLKQGLKLFPSCVFI